MANIRYERTERTAIVSIDRTARRNAIDKETALELADAFRRFEADAEADVGILTGIGGHFCSGADLTAFAAGEQNRIAEGGDGPMGPTRMRLSKPVIAAIEGYAVAGGLELALWCDLRVMAEDAVLGVFCRRFGVPLVDLGTIRLPRLIGHSRAMDLILTGRAVGAEEALSLGLVNRVVSKGSALLEAVSLARQIASFPQSCLRSDRLSALEQWDMGEEEAARNETRRGLAVLASGEALEGAVRFAEGEGRHGVQRESESRS
jgi:enoyl-CoA hydratase